MKLLITTVGSAGDVNPFIAVGAALVARGHDVVLLTNASFEQAVIDSGLSFRELGDRYALDEIAESPEVMDKRKGSTTLLNDFLLPRLPGMIETIERVVVEVAPDVVFTHNICLGTRWVCLRHDVPCALAALSPLVWFSAYDPGLLLWWEPQYLPRPYLHLRRFLTRHVLHYATDAKLNTERASCGFPAERDLMWRDPIDSPLVLGLWPESFRPSMPDDPPGAKICGFVWHDKRQQLEGWEEDLMRFMRDGDPPIVFTLGTYAVHVAGDFYRHAVAACRLLARRGLLLTGKDENAPKDLPESVRAFDYAPYSEVLPLSCAVVHHGGVGTTAQAMRAGVPTVIIPFSHDQFDNAARTRRLGISATLQRHRVAPSTLAGALRKVLDNPKAIQNAARIGRVLQNEDGGTVAAEALEQLAAQRASVAS